jgi:hypothetical protein
VDSTLPSSTFGGLVDSTLPSSTQVRGFEPGQSRRIFQSEKFLSVPSFGGEIKLSVTCRRFAACKTSLHLAWKPLFVGKITGNFLPTVPPFPARGLSRRLRRGGADIAAGLKG